MKSFSATGITVFLALCANQAFGQCSPGARFDLSTPAWNGWGVDVSNARFQAEKAAQIPVERVPRLQLKWAFGFPDVKSVLGQPSIAGGRVFLGVDTGYVYALDAAT